MSTRKKPSRPFIVRSLAIKPSSAGFRGVWEANPHSSAGVEAWANRSYQGIRFAGVMDLDFIMEQGSGVPAGSGEPGSGGRRGGAVIWHSTVASSTKRYGA